MQSKRITLCLPGAALLVVVVTMQSAIAVPPTTGGGAFKVQIIAEGVCCQGCAQKVAAQLYAAPGITSVDIDLPTHTLIITAKASPKLTLERLWQAVEKGEGKPSKLVTTTATYTLTRTENLKPEERPADGKYLLVVREMNSAAASQKIADQLYAVHGVKSIGVDMAQRMLVIEPATREPLSPWALAAAVEKAGDAPTAIAGPHGLFRIERPVVAEQNTAARSAQIQAQGGVR